MSLYLWYKIDIRHYFLKSVSTLRTIFKILCRLISAMTAVSECSTIPALLNPPQMLRKYFYLFATGNSFPDFRIEFIQGIAATRLYIIMPVPLKTYYLFHLCHLEFHYFRFMCKG